jgi:hypothetical protein
MLLDIEKAQTLNRPTVSQLTFGKGKTFDQALRRLAVDL